MNQNDTELLREILDDIRAIRGEIAKLSEMASEEIQVAADPSLEKWRLPTKLLVRRVLLEILPVLLVVIVLFLGAKWLEY